MAKLIWSENFRQHWRRDDESCVAECCFTRTTHLLTRHLKQRLPFEMLDSNYFTTYHIRHIWLQVTTICFLNWRNSWKDANLPTTKMLSAHSSTVESKQDQVHFSCRRLCWTLTKYDVHILLLTVSLWTFRTPLVLHFTGKRITVVCSTWAADEGSGVPRVSTAAAVRVTLIGTLLCAHTRTPSVTFCNYTMLSFHLFISKTKHKTVERHNTNRKRT